LACRGAAKTDGSAKDVGVEETILDTHIFALQEKIKTLGRDAVLMEEIRKKWLGTQSAQLKMNSMITINPHLPFPCGEVISSSPCQKTVMPSYPIAVPIMMYSVVMGGVFEEKTYN
jgi:hypothetical protein